MPTARPGGHTPLIGSEASARTSKPRRFLHSDPRGSIIALADCWGNQQATNAYDEYGIPDTATGSDPGSGPGSGIATMGRFRYTGQAWIPELGMYYYKARIYSPTLGRFLQIDPIGYEDQFNLYAYVGNDPVNGVDPTGLCTGSRIENGDGTCASTGGFTTGLSGAAQGMAFNRAVREGLTSALSAVATGGCQGWNCPADFAAPSAEDRQLAAAILNEKGEVFSSMARAWTGTLRDGKERGFWIYEDREGRGFFSGEKKIGTATSVQLGDPLRLIDQKYTLGGFYGPERAKFHTHPGRYPDAARPSVADVSRPENLTFIMTYRGLIWGRHPR